MISSLWILIDLRVISHMFCTVPIQGYFLLPVQERQLHRQDAQTVEKPKHHYPHEHPKENPINLRRGEEEHEHPEKGAETCVKENTTIASLKSITLYAKVVKTTTKSKRITLSLVIKAFRTQRRMVQ